MIPISECYKDVETGMMRFNRTVSTYDMGDEWRMDIVYMPVRDYAEAWIYQESNGVKLFMYGSDLHINNQSLNEFIEMADRDFTDYIPAHVDAVDFFEIATEIDWRRRNR